MSAVLKNFIGGEWIDGTGLTRNINPSNTKDVVGEYAQADKAQTEKAIAAAKAAFPAWARATTAGALRRPRPALRREILSRKEELGRLLAARGRQDAARGHRRGRARRADLRVLRRRGAAPDRREGAVGAPRPRGRDFARAARRRRHDHAVEFPDRDPRLEDRAGALLRQRRGVQAGRTGAGLGACAFRDHQPLRHSPRRVQPRHRPRLGGRPDPARASPCRRDLLHRLGRDRAQDRAGLRARNPDEEIPARDGRQEPAGRARRRRSRRSPSKCAVNGAYLLHRPALHGLVAPDRDRGHP